MDINELTGKVIGAAIEVHKYLGPGLLINFNVPLLKDGIKRIINKERPESNLSGDDHSLLSKTG